METNGRFNPIPVLVHTLAIAAGLFAGWIAMDRITPDFPTGDPALQSSVVPGAVAGDDPDSLFLPNKLSEAIVQLQDQFGTEQGVVSLHLEPGSIEIETSDAEGAYALTEIPVAAPAQIADAIEKQRPQLGLAQIRYMDLVATRRGPRWYVQIDTATTNEPPPWTYGAPLEGTPLEVGGAPPTPIEGG